MAGFERRFDDPFALNFQFASELDDEDGVLASEPHEHDQPNLHKDIVVASREPDAKQCREHAHRHNEDHRQRQRPALVQRSEHQEDEYHRQQKDDGRRIALGHLLVAQIRPLQLDAAGQYSLCDLGQLGDDLC